jgi:hypothetical protein
MFFLAKAVQTGPGAHPVVSAMGNERCFSGRKGAGSAKLTTQLHLASRLRIGGGVSLLPHVYACMAEKGSAFNMEVYQSMSLADVYDKHVLAVTRMLQSYSFVFFCIYPYQYYVKVQFLC